VKWQFAVLYYSNFRGFVLHKPAEGAEEI